MNKPKMPKDVRKTLQEMAQDSSTEKVQCPVCKEWREPGTLHLCPALHVCPAHYHNPAACTECNYIEGLGRRHAVKTEKIVYRTPIVITLVAIMMVIISGALASRLFYELRNPRVITKTIEVPSIPTTGKDNVHIGPPDIVSDLETIRELENQADITKLHKRLAYQFILDGKYRKALKELEN